LLVSSDSFPTRRSSDLFADVLVKALEQIDDWLAEQRDRRRFRMRVMQPRTLQTLFGVDLTFRRRRYLDRQTGKMVYLLDEVLQLDRKSTRLNYSHVKNS